MTFMPPVVPFAQDDDRAVGRTIPKTAVIRVVYPCAAKKDCGCTRDGSSKSDDCFWALTRHARKRVVSALSELCQRERRGEKRTPSRVVSGSWYTTLELQSFELRHRDILVMYAVKFYDDLAYLFIDDVIFMAPIGGGDGTTPTYLPAYLPDLMIGSVALQFTPEAVPRDEFSGVRSTPIFEHNIPCIPDKVDANMPTIQIEYSKASRYLSFYRIGSRFGDCGYLRLPPGAKAASSSSQSLNWFEQQPHQLGNDLMVLRNLRYQELPTIGGNGNGGGDGDGDGGGGGGGSTANAPCGTGTDTAPAAWQLLPDSRLSSIAVH